MVMLAVLQNISRCLTTAENMAYVLTITFLVNQRRVRLTTFQEDGRCVKAARLHVQAAFKRDGAKISSGKCYYVLNWSFL